MSKQKPWKTTARVYDRRIANYVTVKIALEIDWQKIANQLASQAITSKHGKATQLHGAIKAKLVSA